jgi:predicted enzyme related to lactoylglutathione lyase
MGAAFFWALTPTAINCLAKELGPQELGPVEFNLEALQGKGEFKKAIGAVVLREPHAVCEGWIAILAQPAGNRFQIVTPMG